MATPTTHDRIMLDALAKVSFGHFNQRKNFLASVKADGVKSDKQRWWLTKLVVMHRKQVTNTAALVTADKWLRENAHLAPKESPPEPTVPTPTAAPKPETLF
jgi:hypothetical protein